MKTRPTERAPASGAPSAARSEDGKEPLQIRIPTAVKRRFKALAALKGMEPNQLFVEIWEYYEAAHAAPS